LEDQRSQDDKVPTIVQKKYKAKGEKGKKRGKKSSDIGRGKDHKIGSR